jgi:adenine/guanine phosphoribosyltransferase-like PRPP-binding protein
LTIASRYGRFKSLRLLKFLESDGVICCKKSNKRNWHHGIIGGKGKNVILVDDMIDTGGTAKAAD